jgi:hypothetical protein
VQFVAAGILVNGQLSGAQIEANKAAYAQQFVNCTDAIKYRCESSRRSMTACRQRAEAWASPSTCLRFSAIRVKIVGLILNLIRPQLTRVIGLTGFALQER